MITAADRKKPINPLDRERMVDAILRPQSQSSLEHLADLVHWLLNHAEALQDENDRLRAQLGDRSLGSLDGARYDGDYDPDILPF